MTKKSSVERVVFFVFFLFYHSTSSRSPSTDTTVKGSNNKVVKFESVKAALFLPSMVTVANKCLTKVNHCQNYLATLENIRPVLDLAAKDVVQKNYFPYFSSSKSWLEILEFEVDCRNQTQAAQSILRAKERHDVSAIFGPVCDYTVATIVRISGYYSLPLLTPGAFSHSFEDKREFPLTRLGLSYGMLYHLISRLFSSKQFEWHRFVYGYQLNFDKSEVLSQEFCRLLGNGIFERMGSNYTIHFKTMLRHDDLKQWLIDEIGYRFASKFFFIIMFIPQSRCSYII